MTSYRDSHLERSADYDHELSEGAFDAFMATAEERFLRRTLPTLFPAGVPRYLDFACGTGRITSVVEEYSKVSSGVDVSENMSAIAKTKCLKTNFYLQDLTLAPLEIEPVQLVTAFRFFGNAENELRIAALKAINRQMCKGGYLVINNHRNPSSVYIRIESLRGGTDPADLNPSKLYALLQECGFAIAQTFGIGWWFIHRRLNKKVVCQSKLVSLVEPISRFPLVHKYCPDYILVAKKL